MKKILVLAADYPNTEGNLALMFVHVRNLYYVKHGIDVTVLNFRAEKNYEIEGIRVITLDSYKNSAEGYDVLVLHAANLRNHYRFLRSYEARFRRLIFFFHGHEVLKINQCYPPPYDYMSKGGVLKRFLQDCYDNLKLAVWRKYFMKIAKKSHFVFVSGWISKRFKQNIKLPGACFANRLHIINNSVSGIFEEQSYDALAPKNYDFITIRNNINSSKYCVDLVNDLAAKYPSYKFLLIGKGDYFKHQSQSANLTFIPKFMRHNEMLSYINQSKYALMPTRQDTQGVMSCELATFGIGLITSDIEVCREIFACYPNVVLVKNCVNEINLPLAIKRLKSEPKRVKAYLTKDTTAKEVNLILSA